MINIGKIRLPVAALFALLIVALVALIYDGAHDRRDARGVDAADATNTVGVTDTADATADADEAARRQRIITNTAINAALFNGAPVMPTY